MRSLNEIQYELEMAQRIGGAHPCPRPSSEELYRLAKNKIATGKPLSGEEALALVDFKSK